MDLAKKKKKQDKNQKNKTPVRKWKGSKFVHVSKVFIVQEHQNMGA